MYEENSETNDSYNDMSMDEAIASQTSEKTSANKHILYKYSKSVNIVDDILKTENGKEKLSKIAMKVLAGIHADESSQADWMRKVDDAQRLIKLVKEPKNYPLPQSANIKFPLITDACYQFAARTYPEVIQDNRVVKFELIGQDNTGTLTEIATIASDHMNYQLVGPDADWEASVDKLLVVLPAVGFLLKKTYFDPLRKKNISDICNYKDIILRNSSDIQCLADFRRITHVLHCHPNDLLENCYSGIYNEEACEKISNYYSDTIVDPECDLYEQHAFFDLDDDGYEEPYIVTQHKQCNQILRIKARYSEDDIELDGSKVIRINPINYFTDYHFLPSPDGTFMSIGFGILMLHLQETINTILNQLIDAGSFANMQTCIIDSRIKFMGGQIGIDPGQCIRVKAVGGPVLRDAILPFQYKEPSTVLFQLLGLLIQTAKDLTSSTDAMQGSMNATNVPATTMLSMIEQGMKRFSAIQKRFYRSLKEEYRKLFRLNSLYCDPNEFSKIVGIPDISPRDIYNNENIRVFPIADPNLSTDAQRLAQAQVIMSMSQSPDSLINKYEAQKRMLEAAKVANIGALLDPNTKNAQSKPDPKMAQIQLDAQTSQAELQIKSRQQALKEKEFAANLAQKEADIIETQAKAVKLVSDANKNQHGMKMGEEAHKLETIKTKLQTMTQAHQQLVDSNIANKEIQLRQQEMDNQHQQQMTGHAIQHSANQQDAAMQQQQIQQQQEANNGESTASSDNSMD